MKRSVVSLKLFSRMNVGSTTDSLDVVRRLAQLTELYQKNASRRVFVFSGATNILFPSRPPEGLVINIAFSSLCRVNSSVLFVGAGVAMARVVSYCLKNKLQGLEWAAGLPGSVGGAVCGNAGAFGGETKDSVAGVISFEAGSLVFRTAKECCFDYRSSYFKRLRPSMFRMTPIIVGIYFRLTPVKNVSLIRARAKEIIAYRQSHHPLDMPTLGSTFKNIPLSTVSVRIRKQFTAVIKHDPFPILPVAALLDAAGLKGFSIGGAQFSPMHPNFIVNKGRATVRDIKKLIAHARRTIRKKFSITLEEEILIW